MKKSSDPKVQALLEDLNDFTPEQAVIVERLRDIAFETAANAQEKMMYGGIVFVLEKPFYGIFVRKGYITVEFEGGAHFVDPKALLEGSGKGRRHLKIRAAADVEAKEVAFFAKQAAEFLT